MKWNLQSYWKLKFYFYASKKNLPCTTTFKEMVFICLQKWQRKYFALFKVPNTKDNKSSCPKEYRYVHRLFIFISYSYALPLKDTYIQKKSLAKFANANKRKERCYVMSWLELVVKPVVSSSSVLGQQHQDKIDTNFGIIWWNLKFLIIVNSPMSQNCGPLTQPPRHSRPKLFRDDYCLHQDSCSVIIRYIHTYRCTVPWVY